MTAPENQSTIIVSPAIAPSYPHYLHPFDSPGMMLVNSLFNGKGFAGWKRSVVIALSAKTSLDSLIIPQQYLLPPHLNINPGVVVKKWIKYRERGICGFTPYRGSFNGPFCEDGSGSW
ncbi:uncharacterized protein LOC107866092 [Capsicum annuum]|uniref:uncharacterized protein LOC107866092 n=1 Tax=Capsicum annuum TaxID=4072 RepID=UPI001FB1732A|nr:uncharacterized protein LOC107866092 [Capsicum annuum]